MARPPLRRRKFGWIVWVVLLAAAAFGVRQYVKGRPQTSIPVRVHRVGRGRVRDLVSTVAAGRVAAHREAILRAEIAGTVLHRHHRRGDVVAAGEPLVTYDARELEDRVRVAEAAVMLTRAQAEQAEASARVATRNATRARTLHEGGAAPAAEAESLTGQSDVADRAASAARTGMASGVANVQLARDALRHAVLRAPFAGVVLSTSVEEGEVVAPGAPLLALADVRELHVDAELDESDLGRVQVGMAGEVTLDAFPSQRFAGTLAEIAPSVTRDVRGNRSIAIRVDLLPDRRLRVGMSADVDVIVATRENVIAIPPNAVLGRGTDRAVLRVEGGTAHRVPIEIGVATWEAMEVTRGVREGDRLIVTLSSADLVDGAHVEVRGEETTGVTRESAGR